MNDESVLVMNKDNGKTYHLIFDSNRHYDVREINNNVSIHVILEKYLRKKYSFDVINVISQMLDINETTRKDFIEMQKEFKSIGYE